MRLDTSIAALSEVQRPDCGDIMAGGNTYYWSGHSDGYNVHGVVAVSNKLAPMIIEVTPGVISLVFVYAPTEVCGRTMKDAFCAVLKSVVHQCPRRDTLLVLGDFNASTGTDRNGYETCVDPHGPGTVKTE